MFSIRHIRKAISTLIHGNSHYANVYKWVMLVTIIVSIVPLTMTNDNLPICRNIEIVTTALFIIDYMLRWMTADRQTRSRVWSFAAYPFTPMAIIDLLSILPAFNVLTSAFKVARITRLLRIIRVVKVFHYSNKLSAFMRVLVKEREVLLAVLMLALFYIFVTALIMFNVEPHINPNTGDVTFKSFFDALYWATVTLTTVGYGDLCPVTDVGRFISMLSSLFGVAIIALPSGVITASYLDELRNNPNKSQSHEDI